MTYNAVVAKPAWTLGLCLVVFLTFAGMMLTIKADTATTSFLPRGHVSFEQKEEIQRIYNINDPLLVDVFSKDGDIFTPEGLTVFQDVSRVVESMDGIRHGSVRSLNTHDDIIGGEDGFDVSPFLEPHPETVEQARHVRDRVMAFPLYKGLIVSKDGKRAAIVADFDGDANVLQVYRELRELQSGIDKDTSGKFGIAITGPPIVSGTLNVYLNRDAITLNPVAALLTSILLFLCLLSLAGMMLPLTVMLPSVASAFATMAFLDFPFTPFSNAVPVVILATSIADSVHFLSDYYDRRIKYPMLTARDAVTLTVRALWKPIAITSLTTATGFLLLIKGSPVIPVQEFGVVVAVGVMAAMVFSLTALPAAIVHFDIDPPERYTRIYANNEQSGHSRWSTFADRFVHFTHRNSWVFWAFVILVVSFGALNLSRLHTDYEFVKFFPDKSEVYEDYYATSDRYVGANFIDIDIDTGIDDGVYNPEFLNRISTVQENIEEWDVVGNTISLADYIKKMNQAFNEDNVDFYTLPQSADTNAQYFLLYNISGDPRRFDELTDELRSRVNIRVFLNTGSFRKYREFVDWLETELNDRFSSETVSIGGETYVNYNWMKTIGKDVLGSIGLMVAAMYLLGVLFLRSFVGAALMILPVCVGVFLTYAFIGATGVPIGLGTSIFASIAIGAGIDFAIHYLWRYRELRRDGLLHLPATVAVMDQVGKIILFNGLIISGGFAVLLLARTTPPNYIGMYVAITVVASLLTTFLLLSSATRWWKPTGVREPEGETGMPVASRQVI